MKLHILTIFPKMFEPIINESMLKRAQKKGLVKIRVHDLRNWATDKHRTVDDRPYGGGAGMIMMIEPIYRAIQDIKSKSKSSEKVKVVVTSAKGKTFNQKMANSLSKEKELIIICPHYEGVDQRVIDHITDYEISVGQYILTGGEIPAMVVIDAISRLIPGVLGNKDSLSEESFQEPNFLEYPHYTRPEKFKSWKVPKVLLEGDHKKIRKWRLEKRKKIL